MKSKKLKILNLYCGIGGNRKLWGNKHEITAIENDPEIAKIYQSFFPKDKIIVGDAHQYLLDHYKEFDFIWASPPCPSHSRLCYSKTVKQYPDMKLYQEILLLKTWFKGDWCIENVIPYYEPLIKQTVQLGRHYFWSNMKIPYKEFTNIDVSRSTQEELSEDLGIPVPRINARKLLRNCLKPEIGKHILDVSLIKTELF